MGLRPKLRVAKVGGAILEEVQARDSFIKAFAKLPTPKLLVHGGGRTASELAQKLGIPVKMHEGRRITDKATLELAVMVYAGKVNKNLVAQLQALNCQALGLTGADLGLILAEKRPAQPIDFGWVGDIKAVNASLLAQLIQLGIVPVFAALSHDGKGNMLNTNADTIAASLAAALATHYEVELFFGFEKKGVLKNLEDSEHYLPTIRQSELESLRAQGIVNSGMLPKLNNAFMALEEGVQKVWIAAASEVAEAEPKGTKLLLG